MLINKPSKVTGNIKFVSYTGAYPDLCSGVLTLLCEDREYVFGNSYQVNPLQVYYPSFWRSGGSCGFASNYENPHCFSNKWKIDVSELPAELQKYATEIDWVFNENVELGCCGGCL